MTLQGTQRSFNIDYSQWLTHKCTKLSTCKFFDQSKPLSFLVFFTPSKLRKLFSDCQVLVEACTNCMHWLTTKEGTEWAMWKCQCYERCLEDGFRVTPTILGPGFEASSHAVCDASGCGRPTHPTLSPQRLDSREMPTATRLLHVAMYPCPLRLDMKKSGRMTPNEWHGSLRVIRGASTIQWHNWCNLKWLQMTSIMSVANWHSKNDMEWHSKW